MRSDEGIRRRDQTKRSDDGNSSLGDRCLIVRARSKIARTGMVTNMTMSALQLPADEQSRLDICALEPIHIPGSIQPHGALVAADANTFEIRHVSANSAELLAAAPSDLLGQPLERLIAEPWLAELREGGSDNLTNPYSATIGEALFDVIVHISGPKLILEFEPASAGVEQLLPTLNAALRRLASADTVDELRQRAVREIHELVGYERIVAYHFYPDDHGEVVAEHRIPELAPFLHQHFPASDIPAQVRRMYLTRASQIIVSSSYEPVPLVTERDPESEVPLDLTHAELRGISPHHLRYMRNMGNASTFSLSLAHEGRLIGMITCSARTPRFVPHVLRRACEIIAQQLTLQLVALIRRQSLERLLEHQRVRGELLQQVVAADDVATGLCSGVSTLLDLLAADGACVRIGGVTTSAGAIPPDAEMAGLARFVAAANDVVRFSSNSLVSENPELAKIVPSVAGLIVWQCGPGNDFLAWFRPEVLQSIDWVGDQRPENRDGDLSPRNSFALWRQSVTGKAQPWLQDDILQLGELVRDLNDFRVQQSAAADLNRAREVQRALQPKETMPSSEFDLAGACSPTGAVAGDFYDWHRIEGGLAVTLGDVMGKGIGAGMLAAAVRTALRLDRYEQGAGNVVAQASATLDADFVAAASFATLFHARIDAMTGLFSYTDAGHGLSIIVRTDGTMVRLASVNQPLGLVAEAAFTQHSEVLHPGDMLVSFSDGVLDMYDGSLDAIEVIAELVRQATSPQSFVDTIMASAGAASLPDDVTVLAVRRKGE
ncbi:MAG: SpoIIE family protein phosphatase, partial [Rhodoglobus sp.]